MGELYRHNESPTGGGDMWSTLTEDGLSSGVNAVGGIDILNSREENTGDAKEESEDYSKWSLEQLTEEAKTLRRRRKNSEEEFKRYDDIAHEIATRAKLANGKFYDGLAKNMSIVDRYLKDERSKEDLDPVELSELKDLIDDGKIVLSSVSLRCNIDYPYICKAIEVPNGLILGVGALEPLGEIFNKGKYKSNYDRVVRCSARLTEVCNKKVPRELIDSYQYRGPDYDLIKKEALEGLSFPEKSWIENFLKLDDIIRCRELNALAKAIDFETGREVEIKYERSNLGRKKTEVAKLIADIGSQLSRRNMFWEHDWSERQNKLELPGLSEVFNPRTNSLRLEGNSEVTGGYSSVIDDLERLVADIDELLAELDREQDLIKETLGRIRKRIDKV